MSDTDLPQGTQQAGNEINNTTNTNNYIKTVTDQGLAVQATVGPMQKKFPGQEVDDVQSKGVGPQNTSGGPSKHRHHDSSSSTSWDCTTCQRETDTESTCRCTTFHKSIDPETHANLTFKPHERRDTIRTGDVYRIWQPENAIMHLCTVLIVIDRGRCWSVCKVLQEETVRHGSRYKEYCAPIHIHTTDHPCTEVNRYIKQAECHPLAIYPKNTQRFHPECWVDLERSYDIGNEENYKFVYCGAMDKKSFKYAKEKHLELYGD